MAHAQAGHALALALTLGLVFAAAAQSVSSSPPPPPPPPPPPLPSRSSSPSLNLAANPSSGYVSLAYSPGAGAMRAGLSECRCVTLNGSTNCAAAGCETLLPCSGAGAPRLSDVSFALLSSGESVYTFNMDNSSAVGTAETATAHERGLYLALCETGKCELALVAELGRTASLALMPTAQEASPAVAYVDSATGPLNSNEVGDLWLASCTETPCQSGANELTGVKIDSCRPDATAQSSLCSHPSLAVDAAGCPQLAYFGPAADASGSWLKVATCQSSGTSAAGLCQCSGFTVSNAIRMEVDAVLVSGLVELMTTPSKLPLLSFVDATGGTLALARCADTACSGAANITVALVFEVADTLTETVTAPVLQVASNDLPTVVFILTTETVTGASAQVVVVSCLVADCASVGAPVVISSGMRVPSSPSALYLDSGELAVVFFDERSQRGVFLLCDVWGCSGTDNASEGTFSVACPPVAS